MSDIKRKKCCNCNKLFRPDPRNASRQKYCRKSQCRKASKAASQRCWLQKPENQDYFRGSQNVQRVQQWRQAHPRYWQRKRQNKPDALQDPLITQPTENNNDHDKFTNDALQDLLLAQPPVLIGLIANFTGTALQENIVMTLQRLQQLGLDITNHSTRNKGAHDGIQDSHRCRTHSQSPQAVQLDRSAPRA